MKNKEYGNKVITKVMNANDRQLLEFIALEMAHAGATQSGDWKIMYEGISMVIDGDLE